MRLWVAKPQQQREEGGVLEWWSASQVRKGQLKLHEVGSQVCCNLYGLPTRCDHAGAGGRRLCWQLGGCAEPLMPPPT